jgi:predicted CoA-binding protein
MDNEKKMNEMLDKKVWAVIGATPNTEKTANRIYHTLRKFGYETYPVNPNYTEMDDGEKCYGSLEDLPKKPECVDFVIPPAVTMKTLEEMDPKAYPLIWLQPGTYNNEVVEYAEKKGCTWHTKQILSLVHIDIVALG